MTVSNSGMSLIQNNDSDANWTGEDGISTEEFQQGSAAQQWIVGKNANETAVYANATSLAGSKYLIIPIISTISPFYTSLAVAIKDGTITENFTIADQLGGLLHRRVAGQWKFNSHCLQFGQGGGSITLADFTGLDVNCNNGSSGNIRSVLNTYIDAFYHGNGRSIGGTTVGDELFLESNDEDISVANDIYDGCTHEYEGEIFAQTDITVTTTTGNSFGETVVFRDVPNTDGAYTLLITGTANFKNTVKASGAARVSIDASGATAFTHESSAVTKGGTITYASGQTVNSVVYTDCTGFVVPNNPDGCTYTDSGQMTLTGVLSGAIFSAPVLTASTAATVVTDLAKVGDADFTRGTNGYAVELTSIGAGSMNWNGTLSGYRTQATADSPVTATNLGDEAIFVNVASGTLNISIGADATIPSIRSAGAIVNLIAGQSDLNITFSPTPSVNYEYRIYEVTAKGSLSGAVEVTGSETASGGTQTYSYTHSNGKVLAVQWLPHGNDYEEQTKYADSSANNQPVDFNLETDINN